MSFARGVLVLMVLAVGLQVACGPFRSSASPRKGQDLVVLLPEADGTVGRADVSNPSGKVDLATARASTTVKAGHAPTAVVKSHPVPRVTVIGHTDTTGSAASNVELGLRRANVVRALLVDVGIDPAAIDVTSHGEATLLVPTADEVFEPKNRRVEISVR
jgi:hypothetical protein